MATESRRYDVVVVGGGLAGVCAALASARLGSRTALVQDRPVLGGNSSSEIRVSPVGAGRQNPWADETGIIDELAAEDALRNHGFVNSVWDLVLYDAVISQPGLELFLSTPVFDARLDARGRIAAAIGRQLGSERELALEAGCFVDASGDGLFAARAGAPFRMGREGRAEFGESMAPEKPDHGMLPSTIKFATRDVGHPVRFQPPEWAESFPSEEDLKHRSHDRFEHGFFWVEIGGWRHHTIEDNERIRHELLRHVLGIWDHIKNRGDHGAANHVLDWVGSIPGKRESRRFEGPLMLTENDLRARTPFPDRVAYGGWFVDEHTMGGMLARDRPPGNRDGDPDWLEKYGLRPYGIPLRALYSRKVPNLFFAGRNISASHRAFCSARVMKTCAVVGQAVGTAADLCARSGVDPADLDAAQVAAVQQSLLRQGCYIPGLRNEDGADLARSAAASASSSAPLAFPTGDAAVPLGWPCAQLFAVSTDHIDAVELLLSSSARAPVEVEVALAGASDIWSLDGERLGSARATVPPGFSGWLSFPVNAAVSPGTLCYAAAAQAPGVSWSYNNDKHLIPVGVTAARQRPGSGFWRMYQGDDTTGCFALRVFPVQHPYGAANVLSGVTRPERWTHCWISDPAAGMPQQLDLRWPRPVSIGRVEVTFDTNLAIISSKSERLAPSRECVRDYRLMAAEGGGWRPLVEVNGNYRRRRVHEFASVQTDALRLEVLATNGAAEARVFEIRAYAE